MAKTSRGSRGWAARWKALLKRKLKQARAFTDRHKVRDRVEKVQEAEVPDSVKSVVTEGEIPESISGLAELGKEGLPTSLSDLSGKVASLAPAGITKLLQGARSRWAAIGLGWALLASWSQLGGPGSANLASKLAEISEPTQEIAKEVGGQIAPIRQTVEELASRLSQGELSREELPLRLQEQGKGLEGLVDLTVAYEPYASPTGNRLDAPSYVAPEDRLIQRDQAEDYARRSSSLERLPSWFAAPLERAAAAWSLSASASTSIGRVEGTGREEAGPEPAGIAPLIHFGSPFGEGGISAASAFGGVVSATLRGDALGGTLDELADKAEEEGVERVYLLGPEGEILHRAGGPAVLDWTSSGLKTLFGPLEDPTDNQLSRWAGRLLSGESGQFALSDLAGSAAQLAKGGVPGWVEHTPVPGTDWTLAVLYENDPEREKRQRTTANEKLGLGAFGLLMAATLASMAGGIKRSPPGEPPPIRDLRIPGELDYPDGPMPVSLVPSAAALAGAFDALNRRLLNEIGAGRREARASSALLTSKGSPRLAPPRSLAGGGNPVPGGEGGEAPAGNEGNQVEGPDQVAQNPAGNNPPAPPAAQIDQAPVLDLAMNAPVGALAAMWNPGDLGLSRTLPFLEPDAGRYSVSNYLGIGAPFGGGGGFGGFGGGRLALRRSDSFGILPGGPPTLTHFKEYRPNQDPQVPSVPEPSSLTLGLSALLLFAFWRCRWR